MAECKIFLRKIVFLLISISFVSCGINIIEKKDCIPKVKFVSTENVVMHLIKVENKNFSYSDLKINNDERHLCISTPNFLGCDNSFGKLKVKKVPAGTLLRLTGTAKKIKPFGLSTAFKNDITYLQGTLDNITVWVPLFSLNLFSEYEKESSINAESCKILKIGKTNWQHDLSCFN